VFCNIYIFYICPASDDRVAGALREIKRQHECHKIPILLAGKFQSLNQIEELDRVIQRLVIGHHASMARVFDASQGECFDGLI
jgi:hypothetical protein